MKGGQSETFECESFGRISFIMYALRMCRRQRRREKNPGGNGDTPWTDKI